MNKLSNKELIDIEGGSVSGAVVNALLGVGKFILNIGQTLGSSIRRIGSNGYCSLQ